MNEDGFGVFHDAVMSEIRKEPPIIRDQEFEIASIAHSVFKSNYTGSLFLSHLKEVTDCSILSSNILMDIQAEMSPENCAFIREGQNQVVRYIKKLIQYYKDNK